MKADEIYSSSVSSDNECLTTHLIGGKVRLFALFVFLVSRDYCVARPHDTTGLSAVCDCGIS